MFQSTKINKYIYKIRKEQSKKQEYKYLNEKEEGHRSWGEKSSKCFPGNVLKAPLSCRSIVENPEKKNISHTTPALISGKPCSFYTNSPVSPALPDWQYKYVLSFFM